MGHQRDILVFDEKDSKQKIEKECNLIAKQNGDYNSGLDSNIKYFNTVCEDYKAAEEFIAQRDNNWYDCLSVLFKDYNSSNNVQKLQEQIQEQTVKYRKANRELYSSTVKSQYIGCKGCGSKLKTELLRENKCPLCRTDFRSETKLKQLQAIKEKINKLEEKIEQEYKNNSYTIKRMVKIEYHV